MQFKVCNNFLCNDLLISQLWNYLIPTTFNWVMGACLGRAAFSDNGNDSTEKFIIEIINTTQLDFLN